MAMPHIYVSVLISIKGCVLGHPCAPRPRQGMGGGVGGWGRGRKRGETRIMKAGQAALLAHARLPHLMSQHTPEGDFCISDCASLKQAPLMHHRCSMTGQGVHTLPVRLVCVSTMVVIQLRVYRKQRIQSSALPEFLLVVIAVGPLLSRQCLGTFCVGFDAGHTHDTVTHCSGHSLGFSL